MTTICRRLLSTRFFCESRMLRHARLRCIMSWSMPVIAMTMKKPPSSCFQKYCGALASSSQNTRVIPLSAMVPQTPPGKALPIKIMDRTTAETMHTVRRMSAAMTERTPPRQV